MRPKWWWQKHHEEKTGVHTVPTFKDTKICEGESSVKNISKEYQLKAGHGGFGIMPKIDKREINLETGSSFREPLVNTQKEKHNNGQFHVGAGCTTYMLL